MAAWRSGAKKPWRDAAYCGKNLQGVPLQFPVISIAAEDTALFHSRSTEIDTKCGRPARTPGIIALRHHHVRRSSLLKNKLDALPPFNHRLIAFFVTTALSWKMTAWRDRRGGDNDRRGGAAFLPSYFLFSRLRLVQGRI